MFESNRDTRENVNSESEPLTEESAGRILDAIYEKALDGIPKVSRSVEEFVDDYLDRHVSPDKAAKALVKTQVVKCGTSGFLTGLGGLITLPVMIPANISSVMYVQLRMIAAVAKMGGYDIRSDQVQTMIYLCLAGTAVGDVVKDAGIKAGEKTLEAAIKKIPGTALTKINRAVGFRFITKFGEKGVINLGKMVPVIGGVIGGSFDVATTMVVGKNAIRMFIDNEDPRGEAPTEDEIVDIELIEVEDRASLI